MKQYEKPQLSYLTIIHNGSGMSEFVSHMASSFFKGNSFDLANGNRKLEPIETAVK